MENKKLKRLKSEIIYKYGSLKNFCEKTGYHSSVMLSRKLNGQSKLNIDDVYFFVDKLDINVGDLKTFFIASI